MRYDGLKKAVLLVAICCMSGAELEAQGGANGEPRESVPAIFNKLKTEGKLDYHLRPKLYQQLWARRDEALPFLQEKAEKGDLLAQAWISRITEPQEYDTFERALTAYTKRFDNVEDEGEDPGALDGPPRLVPKGLPRSVLIGIPELKKLKPTFTELRGQKAFPFLAEKIGWTSTSSSERQMALVALGATGDARAFDILVEAVRANKHREIEYALLGLRWLGDKRVVPLLTQIVQEDITDPIRNPMGTNGYGYIDFIRENAAEMLGEMGDASTLGVLDALAAGDKFYNVRAAAAQAAKAIREREQKPIAK